jgi:plastocyanin
MMTIFKHKQHIFNVFLLVFCLANAGATIASELVVEVTDMQGHLLKDAVVFLEGNESSKAKSNIEAEIEQKGKQFNPLVTVVQTGTSVNFPNHDKVRHHVYSFSPAKKFELKLYSGVPASPILFDKPGTVVLGCNIHDNMLAFMYIVDTAYYAKTDSNGIAKLSNIPEGKYQLKIWHYALKKENVPSEQALDIKPDNNKLSSQLDIDQNAIVPGR